ncbi:TRAP transporter solute receptor, TAXI family protein [Neorickettsia helminthoeca str. Oregon]|uniref:TRAP transporter solute receptor, TAXI family protein n=1 Tax=Neorickettsia helminthoeca str. Oregon TaxID=1286528 RepID=X5H3P2_9RICK|nr:TAXI family TRAP transporter solute-binding subunit [Neorickettsia helminthoeca]AHX11181.1 TRAP transporter solute receptor, TAXI family protein [Neorickettsia helminthoeca str. Oregon]
MKNESPVEMLNSSFRQIALLLLFFLSTTSVYATERYFLRIGTGSISGVYYATGNAVCRFLKKHSVADKTLDIFCSVQSTPGAMYNLNALRHGDLEIAASQGDWAYDIYHGVGQFSSMKPMTSLRSLFATHKEAFTVLVRTNSNIKSFDEIKGKIVNIGAPGTGVRGTIENIMRAKGWTTRDFKVATELNSSEQVQALCDGKIDVMTTVIGHPSGLFQEALATCGVQFLSLDEETQQKLVSDYPYYYSYHIPIDLYPGVTPQESIKTVAVKSVFYVRKDFPEDKAYKLVGSIFQNFSTLQSIHPAFANLIKVDLVPENVDAPIHPGAQKYYKHIGLLRDS